MELQAFKAMLKADKLPSGIAGCLAALWYDGKNDWEEAHRIAQDIDDRNGAWVHAYLHRKEGDIGNAKYWYTRAGRTMPLHSLDQEWDEIVTEFLKKKG
ncbi:MAG: hypothetical protein Q8937_00900 [Bacteroidota bacterium]|nr:hypothetical protein [Bacteroidota bacterium]